MIETTRPEAYKHQIGHLSNTSAALDEFEADQR